jgi:hypothetical protein
MSRHEVPDPLYPALHVHMKLPNVFLHCSRCASMCAYVYVLTRGAWVAVNHDAREYEALKCVMVDMSHAQQRIHTHTYTHQHVMYMYTRHMCICMLGINTGHAQQRISTHARTHARTHACTHTNMNTLCIQPHIICVFASS